MIVLTFFTVHGLFSQEKIMVMYVNAIDGLRVRSSPNINSDRIGLLPHLTEVIVIEEDSSYVTIDNIRGKWIYMSTSLSGLNGWVFNGYLMDRDEYENYINCIDIEQIPQVNSCEQLIGDWVSVEYTVCEFYRFYGNGTYEWIRYESDCSETGAWYIYEGKLYLAGIYTTHGIIEFKNSIYQLNHFNNNILILTRLDMKIVDIISQERYHNIIVDEMIGIYHRDEFYAKRIWGE